MEWSDVQHMDSYKAFEKFRLNRTIDNLNGWIEAAERDIEMKGYAFTGFESPNGRQVTLASIVSMIAK